MITFIGLDYLQKCSYADILMQKSYAAGHMQLFTQTPFSCEKRFVSEVVILTLQSQRTKFCKIRISSPEARGFIFPEAFRLTLVRGIVRIVNVEVRPLRKYEKREVVCVQSETTSLFPRFPSGLTSTFTILTIPLTSVRRKASGNVKRLLLAIFKFCTTNHLFKFHLHKIKTLGCTKAKQAPLGGSGRRSPPDVDKVFFKFSPIFAPAVCTTV